MKSLLLAIFLAASTLGQQPKVNPDIPNPRIKISYDRFSDITSVTLSFQFGGLVDLGGGSVYAPPNINATIISVIGTVEGGSLAGSKPNVLLVITSRSEEWKYLNAANLLQLIVDGKTRATLGAMQRTPGDVLRSGRGVIEQLKMEVPFSTIVALSKAKKIEMRVGHQDEFELQEQEIKDLKDWVNQFGAQPKP